jgi:hypothetical protein
MTAWHARTSALRSWRATIANARADRTCREYWNSMARPRNHRGRGINRTFVTIITVHLVVSRDNACVQILQRRQFMSPRAHPEFGYFCLSQSFRRKARKALLSTVAVAVVAGGFVLWARDDPHEGALTIVSVNEAPASADTMSTVVRATTAERLDPPASSKATCDGDNSTQVDGKCVVRRTHKSGSLASATEGPQIAAVPANPGTPPLPVAAPPAPKRDNAAVAAKETEPASAAPVGQPPPAQKAGRRTPRSQMAGRGADSASAGSRDARSRKDQRSARTYASSEDSPRQMPGPKSAMKWARQLQDCIGAVRCRAGEQLMRAFLSGGI